ncbi:MAG TPA: hypothetical protein VMU36_12220 [Spirochaetia bacterium]|nr:hypothetical protein [Spirochaetia bacterium]
MKPSLILAVVFILASRVFAVGPQTMGSSHAESGYDYKDMAITVLVVPVEQGMMWMNANYSYPLLASEGAKLVNLVQTAARKIDVAVFNKTAVSYLQEIGQLYTENGALVTVFFETDGYKSSYAVVRVMGFGCRDILLLNKKDAEDFINLLRNANSFVDNCQRQVALFR